MDINIIRMFRIFRVVRVFSKLHDLKRILLAVSFSFGSVCSAGLLVVLLVAMYSVLAVQILDDNISNTKSPHDGMTTEHADAIAEFYQANYGELALIYSNVCCAWRWRVSETDDFAYHRKPRTGSFSRSFFSLLGILTGTLAWTDHMRNLSSESVYDCDAVDALFFSSFVAIVCIIGFNIVVAVLLEGFVKSMDQESEQEAIEEESRDNHRVAGALDPLLSTLSNCWFCLAPLPFVASASPVCVRATQ